MACYRGFVTNLFVGLLSALLATNQPAAFSNLVTQTTGLSVSIPDPNDPVEKEYKKLMEEDDAAHDEVDKWIQDNKSFAEKGGGIPADVFNEKIRARLLPVRKGYEDFLKLHPEHADAHLAYGSFLNDQGEEEAAKAEFEKSRGIDPKNPATWNNLANFYAEAGPVTKAFEYYEKAIGLNPLGSVYYRNLAGAVSLYRKDAKEYYKIEEPQVFDKALKLYRQALQLDPRNYVLATELAETYYFIKPPPTDEALGAWTNALNIATTEIEKEGAIVHLARFKLNAGRFAEAHADLNTVTNETYGELKQLLLRNLADRENKATNASPEKVELEVKPAAKNP